MTPWQSHRADGFWCFLFFGLAQRRYNLRILDSRCSYRFVGSIEGVAMSWVTPILMLIGSNMFMTYAWYGHLKDLRGKAVFVAIIVSWGVAFFEYCLQVPANRLGFHYFSLSQLKVMQEIITISVFAVFSVVYMKERLSIDFLWAALCLLGAAYFMFRGFTIPG
jgi:uncharacterized protein (DUF486 family)